MAINRYSRNTAYQAEDNNFVLDYQQLSDPIINAEKQYDKTQLAQDAYLDSLRSQEVGMNDIPVLDAKVTKLMEEEAALRAKAKGDLTDPLYQDAMRARFRKESVDPFYRKAAFMKAQTDAWATDHQEHTNTYGAAPADWQDPFGAASTSFVNSEVSPLTQYTGIEKRDPFVPKAMDFLAPKLKLKIESGEIEFRKDRKTGKSYVVDKSGGEVSAGYLKGLLEANGELMSSRSLEQLKLDYEEKSQKGIIDKNLYPTFDDFLEETLMSAAEVLSYQWNDEGFVGFVPTDESKASARVRSIRQQQRDQRIKIQKAPYKEMPGASAPIHVPTLEASNKIRNSYRNQEQQLRTEGLRAIGQMVGINAENKFPDRKIKAGNQEMADGTQNTALQLEFTNSRGIKRNIDLTSADAYFFREDLVELTGSEEKAAELIAAAGE